MACFRAEPGDAISALLGGAKFELKQRLVSCSDDAEVVGHVVQLRMETRKSESDCKGSGLPP